MHLKGVDCQGLDGKEQEGLVTFSDTPGCTSILVAYLVADSVMKSKYILPGNVQGQVFVMPVLVQ